MTVTLETLSSELGTANVFRPEFETYTALKIAKLCGYGSDKWTRNQRSQLEGMLLNCRNGKELVEALKTPDGKQYSHFAFSLIQELQRATSTAVPVLKDGQPVLDKSGKAKLEVVQRQMRPDQFQKILLERFGEPSEDEGLEAEVYPEFRAEVPGGTEEEYLEEDPDLVSTSIVWQPRQTSEVIQLADSNAGIVADTKKSVDGFESHITKRFEQMGERMGAIAVQNFTLGFQRQVNQGLNDLNGIQEVEEPAKVARRTTKKKAS